MPRPRSAAYLLASALVHLIGAGAAAGAAPPLFDAPFVGYDTGAWGQAFGTRAAALGDMDGDGDPDAVLTQTHGYPGLSVMKNRGDGSFAPPVHRSGPAPSDAALADVDGDGDLDVLYTVADHDTLRVMRNDGTGALSAAGAFATGDGPASIAVADLNADGAPDAAVANNGFFGSGTTVTVLMHNGLTGATAGFLPGVQIEIGPHCSLVVPGDVDGDGHTDLIAAFRDSQTQAPEGRLRILANDGTGTLTAGPAIVPFPAAPTSSKPVCTLADMDADGDLDLLVATELSVAVRRNDGAGAFGPPESERGLPMFSPIIEKLVAADLDGDGLPDAIALQPSDAFQNGWCALLNDGSGELGAAAQHFTGEYASDLEAADLDNDGDTDVATVSLHNIALHVFANPGAGVFPRPEPVAIDPAGQITEADLDGDGDTDAVASLGGQRLAILRNDGAGAFAMDTYMFPRDVSAFWVEDVSGDGRPDLLGKQAGVNPPYEHLLTAVNNGNGTFAPGQLWRWGTPTCDPQGYIRAADMDGDGDRDVVIVDGGGCGIFPYVRLLRNDAGVFVFAGEWSVNGVIHGMALSDFDGDGVTDILHGYAGNTDGVRFYRGAGDFTFAPPVQSGQGPWKLSVADFNGDGIDDIASIIWPTIVLGSQPIGIALGNGDGTFTASITLPGPSGLTSNDQIVRSIAVADADLDGHADVLLTNIGGADLSLYRGRGDGTLEPAVRYGAFPGPNGLAFADFTGDGRPDPLFTCGIAFNGNQSGVVLLPSLAPACPADFDGNGTPEVGDFTAFRNAYLASDLAADFSGNGSLDVADFTAFRAAYLAGCP